MVNSAVKRVFALIFALALLSSQAAAAELYKAETRQIYCFSDLLRVYADLVDKDENPIDLPEIADVEGSIDSERLRPLSISRFSDTGEGVCDVFLVDVSGSIRDEQMQQVKNAIRTWIAKKNPLDRIAVMTFGNDVNILSDFTDDAAALNAAVDSIGNHDGRTKLYGGICEALKLTDRQDTDLPKRRNIILITDGVNDYSGGTSEEDAYSEIKSRLIPFYSLWMSGSTADYEKGLSTLNSVTEYSGGKMYDMSGKDIESVYGTIKEQIMNAFEINFGYGSVIPDDNTHTLEIKAAQGSKLANDVVSFVMKKTDEQSAVLKETGTASPPAKSNNGKKTIILLLCSAALLALAGALIFIVVKRPPREDNSVPVQVYPDMPVQPTMAFENVAPRHKPPVAALRFEARDGSVQTVRIAETVNVGRARSNQLVLSEPTVSASHARFTRTSDDKIYVEDLHSSNGTVLNGKPLHTKTEIKNGDTIAFGKAAYRIKF